MLAALLACNACRKATAETEDHSTGRFTSWEGRILIQLSPAHRVMFPAGLILRWVSASFQFYLFSFKGTWVSYVWSWLIVSFQAWCGQEGDPVDEGSHWGRHNDQSAATAPRESLWGVSAKERPVHHPPQPVHPSRKDLNHDSITHFYPIDKKGWEFK